EMKISDPARLFAELSKDGLPARVLKLTAAQRKQLADANEKAAPLLKDVQAAKRDREAAEAARVAAAALLKVQLDRLERLRRSPVDKKDLEEAAKGVQESRKALKKHEADVQEKQRAVQKAEQAYNHFLDAGGKKPEEPGPRVWVRQAAEKAMRTPTLWN